MSSEAVTTVVLQGDEGRTWVTSAQSLPKSSWCCAAGVTVATHWALQGKGCSPAACMDVRLALDPVRRGHLCRPHPLICPKGLPASLGPSTHGNASIRGWSDEQGQSGRCTLCSGPARAQPLLPHLLPLS